MDNRAPIDVSVVVSGRNDNWNGSFDQVAPFALAHNAKVLSQFTQDFEQIFVEWAPLEDRPLLSERLTGVGPNIRCFVVPRAVHDGFRPGIAFLQYHARNVGIRRARGRRIVATNADILLTPELVRAILATPPGVCLRAPRFDVDFGVVDETGPEAVLRFCRDDQNRVAEHVILLRYGDQTSPWFENAAGDFACMHRDDWLRCRGFHERVDASLGVDSELVGQANRMSIPLRACDHPVYHIDHPEQQAGRMHMPPYGRTGYDNPDDWGLGGIEFTDCAPRIHRCPAELAGTFTRVDWPPPLNWPEGFDGCTELHDRTLTHEYKRVVFCGLSDAQVGFSLYLDLTPDQRRVWDDGAEATASWRRKLGWETWPDLQLEPAVLYVAPANSEAHGTLVARRAVVGVDLLVVEPGILTTFSPLIAAMRACPARWNTVVLLGFGRHGRMIADWLRTHPEQANDVFVWDDSEDARNVARQRELPLIPPDQIVGAEGGQLVVVTAAPKTGGAVFTAQLTSRGLRPWRDWIACPFGRPRSSAGVTSDVPLQSVPANG